MTIVDSSEEDPEICRELRGILTTCQTPFNWDMPAVNLPIDKQIEILLEKCGDPEEYHQFQWTRFVLHLVLSYEVCKNKKDHGEALEHISWCAEHYNDNIKTGCEEPLFAGLKEVLLHVILATQAKILLAAGEVDRFQRAANLLRNNPLDNNNQAGLQGLKASAYLQYDQNSEGLKRALAAAKEARDKDPDQAEWWFIIGYSLGRIKTLEKHNGDVSTEQVEAFEKAFSLCKDATYAVHLGKVYAYRSSGQLGKGQNANARAYAVKASSTLREALRLQPDCMKLKGRVAHWMVRMWVKEPNDQYFLKKLLDEVVKTSPNPGIGYADLGLYFTHWEKDTQQAIYYYQKSFDNGRVDSFKILSELKWKNGLESQIVTDLEEGLLKFQTDEDQALLLSYLGAYRILIDEDWEAAIICFQKSLDIDPSAKNLEAFKDFSGKYVNLLELITNYLCFSAGIVNGKLKSFLTHVTEKKPQKLNCRGKNQFLNWKKDMENQKSKSLSLNVALTEKFHSLKTRGIESVPTDQSISKDSIKPRTTCQKELYTELKTKEKGNFPTENNVCINSILGPIEKLLSTKMQEMQAQLLSSFDSLVTKEEVKSIAEDVEVMKEEVASVNDKVETVELRVDEAGSRLEQLETKVESLDQAATDAMTPEEMMREVTDRMRRAPNVIFHNLPEDSDDSMANDKALVSKISQAMKHVMDTTDIKVHRIGKPAAGKRRPLIVTFKTASEAKFFLEHLSIDAVKDFDPDLADIGVSRDKTERERKYLRDLREELERRESSGETNLTIKYIKGVPNIVRIL